MFAALGLLVLALQTPELPRVELQRLPGGELQPQLCVAEGAVHLLTFRGEPAHGELVYRQSADELATWPAGRRVGTGAVAVGLVRGGRMALGRGGRVHVVWNGSALAQPRGPQDAAPLLYSRLGPQDGAFEPARNVISSHFGLDGGSAIAADDAGHVWVVWHAPGAAEAGEAGRRIFVARSSDDGATFEPERAAWSEPTGACGCCAPAAVWDRGSLYVLYRGARAGEQRGMILLTSRDAGETFTGRELDEWRSAQCPLSTAALLPSGERVLGAWVRAGAISIEDLAGAEDGALPRMQRQVTRPTGGPLLKRVGAPLDHPALAVDAQGRLLVAALADIQWGREAQIDWRLYDAEQRPLASAPSPVTRAPTWSLLATFARADGSFVVLY